MDVTLTRYISRESSHAPEKSFESVYEHKDNRNLIYIQVQTWNFKPGF